MSITRIQDRPRATSEEVRNILEEQTSRGIYIDVDRCMDYMSDAARHVYNSAKLCRTISGSPLYKNTDREDTARILLRLGASHSDLRVTDNSFTVDKGARKRILERKDIDDKLRRFVESLDEWNKYQKRISYLNQYLALPKLVELSYNGHRMNIARPYWSVLNTGRISAREPSIQNIPKELCDIITHPKRYILLRADSGQIEPRIKWSWQINDRVVQTLIMLYDDAYYGLLHYITEDAAVLASYYRGEATPQKIPMSDENRAQLKTLMLAGSYGSNLANVDPGLAKKFDQRINNHPKQLELRKKIEEYVASGGKTFRTAFGTELYPLENDNLTGNKQVVGSVAYVNHMVNSGLNYPMQGTASELMNSAVANANTILKTEASGDSYIAYTKHDEGAFYVSIKDVGLINSLADTFSYDVTVNGHKWLPIRSDKVIGVKKPKVHIEEYHV